MINNTKIKITLSSMNVGTFDVMIHKINKFDRINELIGMGLLHYGQSQINEIIHKINPFKLTPSHRSIFDIDPKRLKYNEFVNMIDELNLQVEFNTMINYQKHEKHVNDFRKKTEILFRHGDNDYWGNQLIVYDTIPMLNDIKDFVNFNERFTLEGNLPKEIMNKFITSCYTGYFDIDTQTLLEDNFIDFLKFIDQYPSIYVSVDKIERWIIKYIDDKNIVCGDFLKKLCDKYQLKYMYVMMHNKKIRNLIN